MPRLYQRTIHIILKIQNGFLFLYDYKIMQMNKIISQKIAAGERISTEEGLWLYRSASLAQLMEWAQTVRRRINGNKVFFNKNVHIEPTNICSNRCLFCSYRRAQNEEGSWALSLDEIAAIAQKYKHSDITEVHIVGGVHPHWGFEVYKNMVAEVHKILPQVHIKAFTAEELWKMHESSNLPLADVLQQLKALGLQSIPGGGAEVLQDAVRAKICPEKINSAAWLQVHQTAHNLGLSSNATMLYGHVESYEDRMVHLGLLRDLQDHTRGFNAFIPLKYRKLHNDLSAVGEVSTAEDCRNMAVCRLFLDNIPHLKAYWPMFGKSLVDNMLHYGADDLDGTIDAGTQIYSMAGAEDTKPTMTVQELQAICRRNRFELTERDSLYKTVKKE
ncbi:aminodeoxyfutalosine synthase [Bacteroidia bacterium]|nr:aminodeoxyfutalosine synthase [Bacteroidia bacterium]